MRAEWRGGIMQIDLLLTENQCQSPGTAIRRHKLLQFHAKRITIKGNGAFKIRRGQHDMIDTLDHHLAPRFLATDYGFSCWPRQHLPLQPYPPLIFRADVAQYGSFSLQTFYRCGLLPTDIGALDNSALDNSALNNSAGTEY
jgi:hypothetical protein